MDAGSRNLSSVFYPMFVFARCVACGTSRIRLIAGGREGRPIMGCKIKIMRILASFNLTPPSADDVPGHIFSLIKHNLIMNILNEHPNHNGCQKLRLLAHPSTVLPKPPWHLYRDFILSNGGCRESIPSEPAFSHRGRRQTVALRPLLLFEEQKARKAKN